MEQRILQYRRQIDDWLKNMEQAQGTYARTTMLKDDTAQEAAQQSASGESLAERNVQEAVKDKLEEHLVQIGFFQHERLIHLIVTVTFALLEMLAIILSVISDNLFSLLLPVVILILLIPYIRHYYILENEVQKMYVQYDRMLKLQRMSEKIDRK